MSLWAFRSLLWYICVLFVQPQNRFTILYPLHIADISIMTAMALHGMSVAQEGRPLIRFGPATIAGIILLVFSYISLHFGVFQSSSAWNPYIDYIAKNVLLVILIEAMATTPQRVWAVQFTTMIASLWWIKAGLRLAAAGATSSGDRIIGAAVSLVENPNMFAYILCSMIPLYLFFYQQETRKYLKWGYLAVALSAVYIVLQTGSRTGMLALIALGVFLLPRYGTRYKKTLILAAVVVWVISTLVSPGNIERFKTIPNSIKAFIYGDEKMPHQLSQDEQSAFERKAKNKDTWLLIKAYPLFGVGISPNESLFASRFPMATGQVHNEILMAGRMMGFVGMGLYAWFLWLLYSKGRALEKMGAGWWPALSNLGWTFKIQTIVFAVGGYFCPLPWNSPELILVGSVSALWLNVKAMAPAAST